MSEVAVEVQAAQAEAGKQGQVSADGQVSVARCMARLDTGEQCAAPPMTGEPWCWFHHPDLEEERRRARQKGGKGRRRKRSRGVSALALETVQDAAAVLSQEVDALLTCCYPSVARARAVGYCLNVFARLVEVGDFEARLEALEAEAKARWDRTIGERL